ncbi:single-stranded DNA-binding protein [bacterium]|nr:MAG: single-stranded DNA-binding protein [bacterium]
MPSFNRIILVGNLTRDPELRYTQSNKSVAKFCIAVNNPRNREQAPMFIDVIAWDRLGEVCKEHLKKGSAVLVEGRLQIRPYEDRDGVKRKAVEVVIENMQMLDRKANGSSDQGHRDDASQDSNGSEAGQTSGGFEDDEIPF